MSASPVAVARARTAFRVIAFAEAVSWLGLLVGMFFKWVVETTEVGVKVFGPIHGTIFLLYVVTCLVVAKPFRWSPAVLVTALGSALPPFATAIFEVWADRRGLVGRPATAQSLDHARPSAGDLAN